MKKVLYRKEKIFETFSYEISFSWVETILESLLAPTESEEEKLERQRGSNPALWVNTRATYLYMYHCTKRRQASIPMRTK